MPTTLELCEKYFGTRDIYKLLELTKDSLEKDIKKAYYKLSLKVHPDRVPEEEKTEATEKFKVLAKIYQVLTDSAKKCLYDEKGIIDDDDDESKLACWLEIWKKIFKPISTEDIDNYQRDYNGSELERTDIKKAYINGKGCINYMMNSVPFMSVADEPRIQGIVKEMIDAGEVPEYKIFTNEPKDKRNRRHRKYANEKKEAEEFKKQMAKSGQGSLEQQILKRQKEREANLGSFFDILMEKYSEKDDSEEFCIEDLGKRSKKKNTATRSAKKQQKNTKADDRKVKVGRVSKRKASAK